MPEEQSANQIKSNLSKPMVVSSRPSGTGIHYRKGARFISENITLETELEEEEEKEEEEEEEVVPGDWGQI